MKLKELIGVLPSGQMLNTLKGWEMEVDIKGIAYDSREVKDGYLFAALHGRDTNGRRFIPDAVRNGAAAILAEEMGSGTTIPQVIVTDARESMAKLACRFFGDPSKELVLIGVTGTNGKTTTTYLIESILRQAGFKPGVIGTINYRYINMVFDAPHTTPEAPDLQKILRDMASSGVTHCIMEVSSHALSQKRVDGCNFLCGIFTNLTQEHLDYHGTMGDYFRSKARLFEEFLPYSEGSSFAVINIDDDWGGGIKRDVSVHTIEYSLHKGADVYPDDVKFSDSGIDAVLSTPMGRMHISSVLLGQYNLQNIMAAACAGIGLGISIDIIKKGVASLNRVPGRVERISSKPGFHAVVDYAHTGDALFRLLTTIRNLAKARVITVFGCGGNRDRGKRPIMGEVAARLSDIVIITSDNPRNEDPLEIIREIEKGIKTGVKKVSIEEFAQHSALNTQHCFYAVIPDRREAIEKAVNIARKDDFVVIAGKGHEKCQITGDSKILFDDVEEVKRAIRAMEQKCLN